MKDKYTEATSVDDTKKIAEHNLNAEDVQSDCMDSRKREPGEGEDETQGKTLNNITKCLEKLDIESDDEFTERGPTGGIAVTMAMPNIAQKHIPMGPVGVYGPPQQYYSMVNQPEAAGGRRRPDDIEDPPYKYVKSPKTAAFSDQVKAHNDKMFYNIPNFPGDMNDLSQQLTQPMMHPERFNFCGSMDCRPSNCTDQRFSITTTIKNPNAMTGGDVTVQSPISAGINPFPNNIVDDFLETLDKTPPNYYDPLCISDYLGNGTNNSVLSPNNGNNISTLQSNIGSLNTGNNYVYNTTEFHGPNFKEIRRHSDPSESGIESEGGSPWSDQAPSPSSIYTNPSSVDSGCGQSPMHESQVLPGISPPLGYHQVVSPMGYSTTPSPESSSGCDSPGHPVCDVEDTVNFFSNAENLADLDVAIQVINEDMQQDEWKKKHNRPTLHPQSILPVQRQIPSTIMLPGTVIAPTTQYQMINRQRAHAVNQQIVLGRSNVGIPSQSMAQHGMTMATTVTTTPHGLTMPATVTTTAHGMMMTPVVTTTQQVILIPPHNHTTNSPLILVPVPTKPLPRKETATKYKKILPKMPQSSAAPTSNIQSKKPDVVMAVKSPLTVSNVVPQHSSSDNINSKEQQPHQRQLMIARRTVASISREDLKKSDDEGDTYLHIAVCKADRYMVQALLERLHRENLDALVDQENKRRQTPLYLAVFINQPIMVSMFVQFQANVNVLAQNLSNDGNTTEVKAAIHVAASQGYEYHRTLIELLKAKDINVNIVNNNGQTALHCAILAHNKAKMNSSERIQSVPIIETLIRAGAEPSAQDKKSGKTPLMYAIEKVDLTLVETILKTVEPSKVKNVVKTQAFDGSSCLKIAESLKDIFEMEIWNKLWNSLQSAANGSMARAVQYQSAIY